MALASQSFSELKRTISNYEDVICVFYAEGKSDPLINISNQKVEDCLGKAYDMTDSLIKLVKVNIDKYAPTPKQRHKYKIDERNCPIVCYYKNGKQLARQYHTFSPRILKAWINSYFYKEEQLLSLEDITT